MKKEKTNGLDKSLKLLVKTSLIVFVGIFLSKILGYVYRIVIARYFGPEVYGLFSLALMISGWFIAVAALGLAEGLLRFIPLYRGKQEIGKIRYALKFSLVILTITSIISGLLLFLLSGFIAVKFFHNPDLTRFLQIFSIVVPITVISYPYLISLRAFEKINWYSFIYNIAQNFIKVLFLMLFVLLGMNSDAVSLSYLAGMSSLLVLSYLICKYKVPHLFGKHDLIEKEKRTLQTEMLSYSFPLLFFAIVSSLFYWIDSFSIGFYRGVTEVGFYNAAVPIAALLSIAPELFMQLFFPMITREYSSKNLKLIEELSKQVAKWILMVNIPVFAVMLVFPGAVIHFLFGSQYLVAENALRILALGTLVSSVFVVSNYLISMIGKSKLVLMNIVIAAIINLVLNSILVPMQKIGFIDNASGLNGAAIATLISVVIFNMLFMLQTYKYLKIIPFRRKMINLFILAILPTSLLYYLRTIFRSNSLWTLSLLGLVFLAVYIALILASGSLDDNDKGIIKSAWNRIFKKELK
jgi:O-antigen/teichoic acid export membrane protein